MRPTTKNLLHAPLGDFPYARRIIPYVADRLGYSLTPDIEERLCLYLYMTLLERGDRDTDSMIVRNVESKWSHWNYRELPEVWELAEQTAEATRQRHGVPMYGSTSDEARAYWKDRTYGLTAAQKLTEEATSYLADQPQELDGTNPTFYANFANMNIQF
jgi:hypothetical protein